MSASREKRTRKEAPAKPVVKQDPKKGMPKAVKWIIGIVVTLAVLALIGVSVIFNSTYFHTHVTAVTVGEHEITPAEFNYFYREAYYSMSQQYGESNSYLSYMTDMIVEEAVSTAQKTYATYDAAVAEGYTLTEEEIADLDQELEDLAATAKSMGGNANALLASVYGKGCNTKSYRQYREVYTIAARYNNDVMEQQDTSAAVLNSYYNEHADTLDTVTYRQFYLAVTDDRDLEATTALAQTIMEEAAEDPTVMDKYALENATEDTAEYYSGENATILKNINKDSAATDVADWLFDAARQEGDTQVIEDTKGEGCYLLYFISRDNNDYNTVNIRHILVGVEEGADEEAKKAAQETAQSYLEEFQHGDKTEDSFAALAEEYSEDNADEGGLYENVHKGQMVSAFEDWCFDPSRQAGDSGIVETEYGYHVMYFVGEGENYWDLLAKNDMLNAFYTEWIEGLTADYTAERNDFGMQFITTNISTSY